MGPTASHPTFLLSLARKVSQHQVGLPSFLQARPFLCVEPFLFSTMANASLSLRPPGFTPGTDKASSWKAENLPLNSGLSRLLGTACFHFQRSRVKCKAEQGVFVVGEGRSPEATNPVNL